MVDPDASALRDAVNHRIVQVHGTAPGPDHIWQRGEVRSAGGSVAVPSRTPRGPLARSTPQTFLITWAHSGRTRHRKWWAWNFSKPSVDVS
jgi:hypothetical protein